MNLKALSTDFHLLCVANITFLLLGSKKLDEGKFERAETDVTGSRAAGQLENILASASGVKLTRPI